MGKIANFNWSWIFGLCHMVQVDHPTYTIRCRQEYRCSELRCDCDIRCWSGTLLWRRAVWRHLLLVSSVKQVCLLSRPGNITFGPAKNSSLLFFYTNWRQTNVQKGHVSTVTHAECCKRLCAVSHQVLQFSVGNTRSFFFYMNCLYCDSL